MVLVLGPYVSPEDKRRLQQMRAAAQPAPRYVPELSRGYGPGGRGGRTDVSPSEGSALMLDKYGHLLPPRDELLNDTRTPAEVQKENVERRQDDPDFGGLEGEAELSQAEIDLRAQTIIENEVLGREPADMTEMSEVDRARVQEAIFDQLQQPTDFEIEDTARRMAEYGTAEQTVIDQLYAEDLGVGLEVEDHTYHLESGSLVETRPDGSQLVFKDLDAEAVYDRAVEMRQEWAAEQRQDMSAERSQQRQQDTSHPTPSHEQEQERKNPQISQSNGQAIRDNFVQMVADRFERLAPAREARAQRAAEKAERAAERSQRLGEVEAMPDAVAKRMEARRSPRPGVPSIEGGNSPKVETAPELAQRARETMKLNAERRGAGAEPAFAVDPEAAKQRADQRMEERRAASPVAESKEQVAEPSKPLSPAEQAANRGAAALQQNAERGRSITLVEHLRSKPEGHIAVNPKTGIGYRLEGDTVHGMKDGKATGWTMKADDMHKYEQNARQQKQAGVSQQAVASDKPQQAKEGQKPQSKIAQAAQAQSSGRSPTQNAAAQAEATMKANAERRAQQQAQQKNRGQELN